MTRVLPMVKGERKKKIGKTDGGDGVVFVLEVGFRNQYSQIKTLNIQRDQKLQI